VSVLRPCGALCDLPHKEVTLFIHCPGGSM
jgi:hypothetical protein